MSKTSSKGRLLPSLLDRLTDDDPINRSIDLCRTRISGHEKELKRIPRAREKDASKENRAELLKQLSQAREDYLFLSASASSLSEIQDCVKRDLDWLLNAHNFSPAEQLEAFPEVMHSVLNYGLPDFAGRSASGVDVRQLEKMMKQAILDFEPRLMRQTLRVRLIADETAMSHNALTFEIESELWAEPVPIHLHLRTELELESGGMTVAEF